MRKETEECSGKVTMQVTQFIVIQTATATLPMRADGATFVNHLKGGVKLKFASLNCLIVAEKDRTAMRVTPYLDIFDQTPCMRPLPENALFLYLVFRHMPIVYNDVSVPSMLHRTML